MSRSLAHRLARKRTPHPRWITPTISPYATRLAEAAQDGHTCQPIVIDAHPWQEYNAHGNTCHYPGCRLTQEEHATFLRPRP